MDAGLPQGVLSVVFGVPAEISERLLSSPVIRKLSFTGSIPVGQRLVQMAAMRGIRTTMELGGHAPVVVCNDVDRAGSARLNTQRPELSGLPAACIGGSAVT